MKDKLIIIGKAACGKDYLKSALIELGLTPEISYTTRYPRSKETGGVDYNFISENKMLKMICNGEFQEVEYFPNEITYGTSKEQWEFSDVFIKAPYGFSKMSLADRQRSFLVYLDISEEVRRKRLYSRVGMHEGVEERIKTDNIQFGDFVDYDLVVKDPNYSVKEIIDQLPTNIQVKIRR